MEARLKVIAYRKPAIGEYAMPYGETCMGNQIPPSGGFFVYEKSTRIHSNTISNNLSGYSNGRRGYFGCQRDYKR